MRQVLGPGALGRPRGSRWRGRWEGGSGWGTTTKKMHFEILVSAEKRVRILINLALSQIFIMSIKSNS